MSDGKRREEPSAGPECEYAYPADLARAVCSRWSDGSRGATDSTPDVELLESLFSVCYQASLLREEERPVTFRAILAEPGLFSPDERPPEGLQRLELATPLCFTPGEVRRLSVATDLQRTLIGVYRGAEGDLRIWGLINSGTRWMRDVRGGRQAGAPLPAVPVVRVDAPGSMVAYRGDALLARLHGGRLSGAPMDLFASEWLPAHFIPFRDALVGRHEVARQWACDLLGETWAALAPDLPRRITERLHKRVIAEVRDERHGGTLLFLPPELPGDGDEVASLIDLRYRFVDSRYRESFPDVVVDILNRLAQYFGAADPRRTAPVSWREFETTTDDEIETLEEALFEMAHLLAGLAAVDGAVVLSHEHELLGFGGMISGRLSDIETVHRAVDLEATKVVTESVGGVGARHRAAYRLAAAVPGAVVIVISQDGGARFVAQRDGRVVYWDQD